MTTTSLSNVEAALTAFNKDVYELGKRAKRLHAILSGDLEARFKKIGLEFSVENTRKFPWIFRKNCVAGTENAWQEHDIEIYSLVI